MLITIFNGNLFSKDISREITLERDADNKISGFSLARLPLVYRLKRLEILNWRQCRVGLCIYIFFFPKKQIMVKKFTKTVIKTRAENVAPYISMVAPLQH